MFFLLAADPQFTNAADVVANTSVDLSSYAGVMGKVLGALLATIIVVALCFIVIKKGSRFLRAWICGGAYFDGEYFSKEDLELTREQLDYEAQKRENHRRIMAGEID